MQFRRQCRLRDILKVIGRSTPCLVGGVLGMALAGPALGDPGPLHLAQLGPNGGGGPSYGYQPYNDRNPTGFYHPNGTGYGHYYLTQKYHAPRIRAFRYRKFRGT